MEKARSAWDYLMISLKGFCMGAADVVPGVSGGTIAFITGIYEELLTSIRSFDLRFFRLITAMRIREAMAHTSWPFLVSLILGIFAAILSLARILAWLLQSHPVLIWSFFFGLVLASALTVARDLDTWRLSYIACTVLGTLGAYFLVGMVPVSTPDTPWFLFLSGSIAICAMILPGISGSFILVLLGKYQYVLQAVNDRDLLTLIVVGAGAVVGIITFVRLLGWLLARYRYETMAVLTGFMLGSLRRVWPWKTTLEEIIDAQGHALVISQSNSVPSQWNSEVTFALCLAIFGFLLVLFLNFLAGGKDRPNALHPES
ncbi:MAG: DUF368 domain-containing protein [Desulfatiglandales bacterium]